MMALAACDPNALDASLPVDPDLRPATAITEPSAQSVALSQYYARVESGLLTQGLLRTNGGGPDVPFTTRNLVDNFVRIALFEEYVTENGRIVARQTESELHRWETPIRMKVEFGASVPDSQRQQDRSSINSYASRLARLTGLSIRQTGLGANYHVFVVNEDERLALGPRIKQVMPGITDAAVRSVVNMPRSTFCVVFALAPGATGSYTRAVAVIRGEHPDLMRLSCIHEELAQGLGLSNDSPKARPSIFNDDEEFALLTTHDEMLLRILYDERMKAGMSAPEARVQAEIIAAELMGGGS